MGILPYAAVSRRERRDRARPARIVITHLALAAGAFVMIVPFLWMASTSLKSPDEVFAFPPVWIPRRLMWRNFAEMWNALPFGLFFLNSTKLAVLNTAGTLLSCSMAAFGFSVLRFRGRNALFLILLATMMIPYPVVMIPTFILFKYMRMIDTHYPLWLFSFLGGAYGTFLLRQFFLTIPHELVESARIDGANPWQIYARIFLPLSGPALATLGIFTFMSSWNNLLGPLIYLNTLEKLTLTTGLSFFQFQYTGRWTLMMAGAMVSIVPILAVYVFAQRYFIKGIALTGIKA
ncbi:MAG: carbohydrate ABC transporter permease [Patescibacteria group bacterium]